MIADHDEQTIIDDTPLRRIPTLMPGERQLPAGPGEDPPTQPSIEGLEPDLPAIIRADGQEWEIDRATGELQGRLPDMGEK